MSTRPFLRASALALLVACAAKAAPVVTALVPAPDASVSVLTGVSVTFSEPVTGLDASDLLVNGQAVALVSGSGAGPYSFAFTQPPPGTVSLAWDPENGIAGVGTGAFDVSAPGSVGGATWAVQLSDALAPTVGRLATSVAGQEIDRVLPVPGSTPSVITEATVFFSEAVTGVDAADLLVNGSPAASVTGDSAGPWVFAFSQPADGVVTFQWAVAPGIVDLAGNPFVGGGSWSVTKVPALGTPALTEMLVLNGGTGFGTPANGIRDEDFDLSPWVELTNAGATSVDLTGWSLTDDTAVPDRWIFPTRTLAAGGRLIVWLSGKDRKPVTGHLHANFSPDSAGGTLALFPPDSPRTTPASVFAAYPVQRYDYSFGRQTGDGAFRYFTPPSVTQANYTLPSTSNPTPTPPAVPNGVANPASALVSAAAAPHASVGRGFFDEPFDVVLSSAEPAATIRYTLNGSVPNASSPPYTTPLAVTGTTVLRFAAFAADRVPSETVTHSYLFLDAVASQPSPPYDNPANANDDTNPQPPSVGGQALPVAWGSNSTFTAAQTLGGASNLAASAIPADYGMDAKITADPGKYNDSGASDPAGKTNLERISEGLRELPMLSLVMRVEDMFGDGAQGAASPSGGLYPNSVASNKTDRTKPCSLELILPDGSTGFAVTAGIDNHGNASRDPFKNPKHGYTLRFKGKYGAGKLEAAGLFPGSPVSEWDKLVLRADFNSSWRHQNGTAGLAVSSDSYQRPREIRCRDAWSKDAFRDMGRMAGHHRYTNLFINGVYWGTYDLAEDQADDFGASYFGGEKADYDVIDQGVLKSGTWVAYSAMKSLLGWTGGSATTDRATAPTGATYNTPFTNAQYEQLRGMLDVPWFIDYMVLHWFTGHRDWATESNYNKNWYVVRPKDGKFMFLPWDQENLLWHEQENRVSGMTTFAAGATPSLYPPAAIHPRAKANAEYRLDCADRIHRHCIAPGGALTPEANIARLDKWTAIMNANAMCLESARWGDYRYKVHSYTTGTFNETYTWNGTWLEGATRRYNTGVNAGNFGTYVPTMTNHWRAEVNRLRTVYFPARTANLLAQLRTAGLYPTLNAPEFRNDADNALTGSSRVPAGFRLRMQLPAPAPSGTSSAGTIYYTLDGTDPRVPYDTTGQRTPAALAYSAPLPLSATTTVKARTLNGTTWSALNEATFTVGAERAAVAITELFYNPTAAQGGSAAEFIEVQNTGPRPVDLGGWHFSGVNFIFPHGFTLAPGARAVLANNQLPSRFATEFPGVVVAGYFGGNLSNAGERLTLLDATGRARTAVEYDDDFPWPVAADGGGYSLEMVDAAGDPQSPLNWQASAVLKGTPGAANSSAPAPAAVVITEILAKSGAAFAFEGTVADFVELTNTSGAAASLAGWTLTVGGSQVTLAQTLAPGETLIVPCQDRALPAPGLARRLNAQGGTVVLSDATGKLRDGLRYGPQATDVSLSRVGGVWRLTAPTPGAASGPALATAAPSAVRINEWLANPERGEDDWVELFNSDATEPLDLTGLTVVVNATPVRIATPAAVAPGGFVRFFLAEGSKAPDALSVTLPAKGATISVQSPDEETLDAVAFGAQAEGVSEGRLPDGAATVSTLAFPSPGVSNHAAITGAPVVNEVLVRNIDGDNAPWARRPGWIELKNTTPGTLGLGGWQLRSAGRTWTFPPPTPVAAGGVIAVWCDPAQPASAAPEAHLNAALDLSAPGSLELLNPAGQIAERLVWGNQIDDRSIGRDGAGNWALLERPTRGAANAPAAALGDVSALRINEWFDRGTASGVSDLDDFLEVCNTGNQPVALDGLWLGDSPSELGRGRLQLPPLSFVAAGGFVAVDASQLPFGIDGQGEYLRLSQNDADFTPLDAVSFGRIGGEALGRLPDGAATVVALRPTPGVSNATTGGPLISLHPQSVATPAGSTVTLLAAGTTSAESKWQRNGVDLPLATGFTLTLDEVDERDEGLYTLVLTEGGVSTVSEPARVTVLHTYATWAASHGVGAAGADDDGDGLTNGAEFLAGSDPTLTASPSDRGDAGSFAGLVTSPPALLYDLRLSRRAAFSRLYGQLSADFTAWAAHEPSLTEVLSTEPDGSQHLRFRFDLPPDADRQFLRLVLEP